MQLAVIVFAVALAATLVYVCLVLIADHRIAKLKSRIEFLKGAIPEAQIDTVVFLQLQSHAERFYFENRPVSLKRDKNA
jgi:uncharacterized membrane protein (DUF106 family)